MNRDVIDELLSGVGDRAEIDRDCVSGVYELRPRVTRDRQLFPFGRIEGLASIGILEHVEGSHAEFTNGHPICVSLTLGLDQKVITQKDMFGIVAKESMNHDASTYEQAEIADSGAVRESQERVRGLGFKIESGRDHCGQLAQPLGPGASAGIKNPMAKTRPIGFILLHLRGLDHHPQPVQQHGRGALVIDERLLGNLRKR